MARRGKDQMPPISSNQVDHRAVALLKRWIEELP